MTLKVESLGDDEDGECGGARLGDRVSLTGVSIMEWYIESQLISSTSSTSSSAFESFIIDRQGSRV